MICQTGQGLQLIKANSALELLINTHRLILVAIFISPVMRICLQSMQFF